MKKISKNTFLIIIGMIISCSIGVYAGSLMNSGEVTFIPNDDDWQVTKVDEALNDLYSYRINENSFTNAGTDYSGGNQIVDRSVSLELEKGKYIISAISASGWGNSRYSNPETYNKDVDISCSNCTYKSLSNFGGWSYTSGKSSNAEYIGHGIETTLYYVELTDDDNVIFSKHNSSTASVNGNSITVNAVKIK